MKAKKVFEALSDILKPPSEKNIKSYFIKHLGNTVGEWLFTFYKTNKIYDLIIYSEKINILAEFSIKNYNFQLFSDKRLKVMPPESVFFTSTIHIKNYEHFSTIINDWLNGEYKEWETSLVKMTNDHFDFS